MPEVAEAARRRLPNQPAAGGHLAAGPDGIAALGRWPRTTLGVAMLWLPFLVFQAVTLHRPAAGMGLAQIVVFGASFSWALFLTCHLLANGRWWVWLAVSLLPPLLFAAAPALLLIAALAARGPQQARSALIAVAALVVAAPQSGLNAGFLLRRANRWQCHARPIRIVSWNTEYWHQNNDPQRFYAYLRGLDADIYLLQEYIYHVGKWNFRLLDDDDRLFEAFADFKIVIKGQLVTISRLPIVDVPDVQAPDVLRVDVQTVPQGRILSTYNVHIPVQIAPVSPLRRTFYRAMRDRAATRNVQYHYLARDLAENAQPAIVAGDFNASPAVGDLRRLAGIATDAIRANNAIYPVSWHYRKPVLRLWRLDWVFVSGDARVHRYDFVKATGFSDHGLQRLLVAVG